MIYFDCPRCFNTMKAENDETLSMDYDTVNLYCRDCEDYTCFVQLHSLDDTVDEERILRELGY